MDYYWRLEYGDYKNLKSVDIGPASVEVVKRRWEAGQPIHTTSGSIPASQIRSFELTNKPFTTQPLIEAVAQAFNEPMITEDGEMLTKWVKKDVTHAMYNKHYSNIPGYRHLAENGGMTTVAFKLAVHSIDLQRVELCTAEEEIRLTKR